MSSLPSILVAGLLLVSVTVRSVAAPGDVDATFNPDINDTVFCSVVQTDGKILIGGRFSAVGGSPRNHIARLNANGTLDTSFNPNADDWVTGLTLQADGKIIVCGSFSAVGGLARPLVTRLHADGTVDPGFNPVPLSSGGSIHCAVLQADGKIVIGGTFATTGAVVRHSLVRLHTDGIVDESFNANPVGGVFSLAAQPDGKIVAGGAFDTYLGAPRKSIVRFLANGTLDADFDAVVNGPTIYTVLLQPDGKILMGGNFQSVGGVLRNRVARVNANGTLDTGFNPNVGNYVYSLALQADGKVLIGGEFTRVGSSTRNGIARVSPNSGTVDATFNPALMPPSNTGLRAEGHPVLQPDGRILISGTFESVGGQARKQLARLTNDAVTESLAMTLPNRVRWMRGGAAPEIGLIDFEVSTDGGNIWSPLGSGVRISGGWELTDLTLPMAGHVRARARSAGGYFASSQGMVESAAHYTASPLQLWRHAHFGTPIATGAAANNADPDKDGLENLVEFAFGLNPNAPDAAALPEWELEDDDYSLSFTRPAGVDGISYIAEYSSSLAPGSWTSAVNISTPPAYQFYAPAIAQRQYLRVRVTSP